jgi:hypothetical protein
MSIINRTEIERLALAQPGSKVSIYMPCHRTSPDRKQDPILFKNLLVKAESALGAAGMPSNEAQDLLADARRMLDDQEFWTQQADGLALFATQEWVTWYRLPVRVEELLICGERFHLKPLLPLLSNDGHFHILALSQNRVRLIEASRDAAREIDLHDIPESLQEAVGYDWQQRSLQFHTGTGASASGAGVRVAMFHGQGRPDDKKQAEINTFLRLVDVGVTALLESKRSPLVLAGVEYVISMFRELSGHQNILEGGVIGNPDDLSLADLHREAWALVEPMLRAEPMEAAELYANLGGTDRACENLKEVVLAAFNGRIDTVFVALGEQRWGVLDLESQRFEQHAERQPGDHDLLDHAAVQSLIRGATVYAVPPDEVPGGGAVAAVFRY